LSSGSVVSAPAWLPDWTDETVYPLPDETPTMQWGWEFLRRNPAYQLDWAAWIAPLLDETGKFDFTKWRDSRSPGDPIPFFALSKKYRLHWASDPAIAKPPFNYARGCGRAVAGTDAGITSIVIKPNEVSIKFDLDDDLGPQLEIARYTLKELFGMKLRTAQRRSSQWPRYLRLLDAEAVEADRGKIGDVLYSEVCNDYPEYRRQKMLRDDITAAHRMRDKGYVDLLRL
jgi:hypothetical protein